LSAAGFDQLDEHAFIVFGTCDAGSDDRSNRQTAGTAADDTGADDGCIAVEFVNNTGDGDIGSQGRSHAAFNPNAIARAGAILNDPGVGVDGGDDSIGGDAVPHVRGNGAGALDVVDGKNPGNAIAEFIGGAGGRSIVGGGKLVIDHGAGGLSGYVGIGGVGVAGNEAHGNSIVQ